MRLVQVVGHLEPGGALRIARLLHDNLRLRCTEASLIAMRHHVFARPEPEERVLAQEGASGALAAGRGILALFGMLAEARPHVVISHTPKTAAVVNLAALLRRVPVRVVVQHTPPSRLSTTTHLLDGLMGWLGVHTDIVFVGESVAASYDGMHHRYRRRSRIILNGIPTEEYGLAAPPADREPPASVFTALTVARLDEDKNIAVLVTALAALPHTELVVAGDGPLREDLALRARALDSTVHLLGHQEREQVAALYASCDVFLFPSRVEALPLVLMEAAASGIAIVASDIPPNREVLGSAAIFCPPDDPESWARAVALLKDQPAVRQDLARRVLARSRHFDRTRMAEEYWSVISRSTAS